MNRVDCGSFWGRNPANCEARNSLTPNMFFFGTVNIFMPMSPVFLLG